MPWRPPGQRPGGCGVGHPRGIDVFELKVGESAAAALEQVKRKGYDAPYRADERPIWLIGLNFDRETRQLVDTAVEAIDKK